MLDKLSAQAQLWTLPYPRGKYGRLTNDTSQYVGLSVTADRNEWVTSRLEASFGVWTSESGSPWREMVPPTTPAKASIGFGLRWIGDDLLFVQGTGTGLGVVRWRASTRKTDMLAPGGGFPSVSRDGSTIVYFHFDKQEQWRMDGDGSNPVRLGRGTFIPSITPDGRQVVVAGPRSETVRLIPTDATGIDQVIKSRVRGRGEVSPDGQRLAFEAFDEQDQSIIALCDLPTCSKRQPLPPRDRWHWTPDGRGLAYVDPVTSNLWFQPIDGGTAKPLRDFPNDGLEIWDFDWSADGNRLAVARARISWDIVLFRRLRPSE
jgi:hypothetical protein